MLFLCNICFIDNNETKNSIVDRTFQKQSKNNTAFYWAKITRSPNFWKKKKTTTTKMHVFFPLKKYTKKNHINECLSNKANPKSHISTPHQSIWSQLVHPSLTISFHWPKTIFHDSSRLQMKIDRIHVPWFFHTFPNAWKSLQRTRQSGLVN